jgi:hypothetical protein
MWKKLNDMCPELKDLILVCGNQQPGPMNTLEDLEFIYCENVDKFREKEWVDKILAGCKRNTKSGNITTAFRFKYARLKRNLA